MSSHFTSALHPQGVKTLSRKQPIRSSHYSAKTNERTDLRGLVQPALSCVDHSFIKTRDAALLVSVAPLSSIEERRTADRVYRGRISGQ